nr:hypothetical protein [Tanacetum cinerariifolium]
ECGDPLDGIFYKQCTCKSCGKDAHIGYNCPSKVSVISILEPCNNQTIDELPQALPIFHPTFHSKAESPFTLDSTPTYVDESPNVFNPPPQPPVVGARTRLFNVNKKSFMSLVVNTAEAHMRIFSVNRTHPSKRLTSFFYDDDDDYNSAITPILSTKEPIDSLSMGDEHLDTIPATESDEVINSSVKDLVPIPSEFKGIPDTMCDVHFDNNHTPLEAKDHVKIVMNSNDDISSSDDDSLHEENIEYVKASPYDAEIVSLEAAEIVILEVEEIKDDNLREKLLNAAEAAASIKGCSFGAAHRGVFGWTAEQQLIRGCLVSAAEEGSNVGSVCLMLP